MPAAVPAPLIHQLAVGDPQSVARLVEEAQGSEDVTTLVAAALFAAEPTELMGRATALAATSRERQLVAIATAHLAGDRDRVEDLARDHLADHPDGVLVAWITAAANQTHTTRKDPS